MRDPVERALSHYWYNVRGGSEGLRPLDAIRKDEQYVAYGDYLRQLQPYFQRFGQDAVYLLTLEELVARPAQALNSLFGWLGVEPWGQDLPFDARNVGSSSMKQLRPGAAHVPSGAAALAVARNGANRLLVGPSDADRRVPSRPADAGG